VINYIFSEQVSPDWIFKTSFISVLHKVRDLAQYPSYIKDNQTFYEDYINEVKPYRTKIREYLPKQTGIDYLHTGATDFDLPGYYDTTTGTYRSPDGSYSTDGNLLLTDDYIDWSNNYTYKVVDINVANGGSGYTLVPNVTISGGGGSGAVAQLFVANGSISSAKIITPGAGYVSTPTLTVNGNGTGAVLVPVLKNEHFKSNTANSYNTVRSITTEIKFDRLLNSDSSGKLFRSNLRVWQANTAYTATIHSGVGSGNVWLASGNLVAYNNEIYAPVNANTSNQPTFDGSLYQKLDAGNTLITSDERIIGYYQPGEGMYDANIALLVNGVEYPGVKVVGSAYSAYTSNVNVGANVSFHSSNSSIVSSNIARVNFLSLGYTSNQQLSVFGSAANDSAFRIVSVTDRVMTLSHSTVVNEAAGANITLRYLTDNDLGNYDAAISSTYLDTALGSRPEDINIDGGAYIDTYNSFGPEEMVPGQVFDTLEMRVFTLNATSVNPNNYYIGRVVVQDIGYGYYESNITITATGITGATFIPTLAANGAVMSIAVDNGGTGLVGNVNPVITITGGNLIPATATAYLTQDWYDTIGYRSFYTMNQDVNYYRISAANTTVLTSNLNITDSNIHVANASILPDPSPESVLPGIVFINGEKIHYYLRDVHNNVLGYIRRAVDGTGAPMVHESGTQVSDAGLAQAIPGSPHTHTMLDMTGNSWTTGTGLAASSTTEATFLKASLSYTP
jgi:hypothetical protein